MPFWEEIIAGAVGVRWDEDALKKVYEARCHCNGRFLMVTYHRNPHLPDDPVRSLKRQVEGGSGGTIDVIECTCSECSEPKYFAFAPERLHTSIEEMLRANRQWIRTP
jgi:hypothetical protein